MSDTGLWKENDHGATGRPVSGGVDKWGRTKTNPRDVAMERESRPPEEPLAPELKNIFKSADTAEAESTVMWTSNPLAAEKGKDGRCRRELGVLEVSVERLKSPCAWLSDQSRAPMVEPKRRTGLGEAEGGSSGSEDWLLGNGTNTSKMEEDGRLGRETGARRKLDRELRRVKKELHQAKNKNKALAAVVRKQEDQLQEYRESEKMVDALDEQWSRWLTHEQAKILEGNLAKAESANSALQTQLKEQQAECNDLRKEVHQGMVRCMDLERRLHAAETCKSDLKKKLEEHKDERGPKAGSEEATGVKVEENSFARQVPQSPRKAPVAQPSKRNSPATHNTSTAKPTTPLTAKTCYPPDEKRSCCNCPPSHAEAIPSPPNTRLADRNTPQSRTKKSACPSATTRLSPSGSPPSRAQKVVCPPSKEMVPSTMSPPSRTCATRVKPKALIDAKVANKRSASGRRSAAAPSTRMFGAEIQPPKGAKTKAGHTNGHGTFASRKKTKTTVKNRKKAWIPTAAHTEPPAVRSRSKMTKASKSFGQKKAAGPVHPPFRC